MASWRNRVRDVFDRMPKKLMCKHEIMTYLGFDAEEFPSVNTSVQSALSSLKYDKILVQPSKSVCLDQDYNHSFFKLNPVVNQHREKSDEEFVEPDQAPVEDETDDSEDLTIDDDEDDDDSDDVAESPPEFHCQKCDRNFATERGLRLHTAKTHSSRASAQKNNKKKPRKKRSKKPRRKKEAPPAEIQSIEDLLVDAESKIQEARRQIDAIRDSLLKAFGYEEA